MSGDAAREAPTLSWATKLELGIKEFALDHEQRIDIRMGYLQGKAPLACYDTNNCKEQTWHCLSCLENNETSLNAVALYILWFSRLHKHTQQLILMEKIRGAQLLLNNKTRICNKKGFFLPYRAEVTEVTKAFGLVTVCKYAMTTLLRYGNCAWDTCKVAVDNATMPEYGVKGKSSLRSLKKYKEEVKPGLIGFFQNVILPLLGQHPTRATAEDYGAVIWDSEDTLELDPEWTKRRLFGRYCYDLGYTVKQSANGSVKFDIQADDEWATDGIEKGMHCS